MSIFILVIINIIILIIFTFIILATQNSAMIRPGRLLRKLYKKVK